jgi:rfaE bifunctional protein nucleotidyltransferase chain/domain
MNRVIGREKAVKLIQKIKIEGKTVVLTGGCFDVLHLGHVKFLKAAKKSGDALFAFVENDQNVQKIKGDKRPINSQNERAETLASMRFVDFVIKIPFMNDNEDYDKLIMQLKPSVIAVTKGSEAIKHAQRQAKKIGCQVVQVIGRIPDQSTSKIAQIISDENKL